ncbi:MAG: hypothetical protein ACOWW1_07150 [archaeon]
MSKEKKQDIWYPDEKLVDTIHDTMIEKYGGWKGYERGVNVFSYILEEVKEIEGIYKKAAFLLRNIVSRRIYIDGNHRTAQGVTQTFLEVNNLQMKINDTEEIISFIKHILLYNIDEIAEWLENGTT